jgi:hypothetical protein
MDMTRSMQPMAQVCTLKTLVILLFTPHIEIFPCLMFFMFLKPQKVLPLFIVLHPIIMFSLSFTLISFLSRIGSRGKFFCKAGLKWVFIPLPCSTTLVHAGQVLSTVKISASRWHARLGHSSSSIVKVILSKNSLPVISDTSSESVCDACQQDKSHQLPYPVSTSISKGPLELIFSNVWGPACDSIGRYKYHVTFIDDYSKFTWLFLLKHKSEVF